MRMKPKQIKLVTTNSGGKPVRSKKFDFTHFLEIFVELFSYQRPGEIIQ